MLSTFPYYTPICATLLLNMFVSIVSFNKWKFKFYPMNMLALCLLFYYYYASVFDAGLLVDNPLLAVVVGASYCM